MNFQQFISILLARKRIMLIVFSIVVTTTVVISLIWPKSYTGVTTVVLDVKNPDPVSGMISQGMILPSYLATQVDIITSDRVARRVVKMLGFDKVPDLVQAWKDDTDGMGTFEGYYAIKLEKKLDVKPSKESSVITISFTGSDPKFSAVVANAFAKAYLDTNAELTIEPAKEYTEMFAEQAKLSRDKMMKAQDALSVYQKANGIVSVDERLDVETNRLNDLANQLTLFQAQKSDAQSRQHAAKGDFETNPDVMNSPVIQNLRVTISAAEGKLHESENTLGKNHPQIQEQRAELDALKSRLQGEMANVATSLGANTRINTQKEVEIQAALEAQKQRVLDLKQQHDQVSVLQKDLESSQLDYNNIRQRLSQSSLQSQNLQTSVMLLTPAYEPDKPSWPKIPINILLSIFLGGLLSIGVGLMMELVDRRIRSVTDLADFGIPVLGMLTIVKSSAKHRWFWRVQKTPT